MASGRNNPLVLEAEDDMLHVDGLCAFTINPDPNRYPTTDPSLQYMSLLMILYKYTPLFATFIFVPELTEQGNVHIHGVYTIKDKIGYYKKFLPHMKSIGFVKVKPVFNSDNWINYITKDIPTNLDIFDDMLPIPLTHWNVCVYKRMNRAIMQAKKLRLTLRSRVSARVFKRSVIMKFKEQKKEHNPGSLKLDFDE